jgi:hypothetical protein
LTAIKNENSDLFEVGGATDLKKMKRKKEKKKKKEDVS